MERIQHGTADEKDGKKRFREESIGKEATYITAEWLNSVQEELCSVIDSQGIPLNHHRENQLLEAIEKIVSSAHPVGSVVQSFASESIFSQQMKGKGLGLWVLADGNQEKIAGKQWERLGIGTLPDCRGRFLRGFGGKSGELGERQAQATAVNGLTVSVSSHEHKVESYHYAWGAERGDTGAETARTENATVTGFSSGAPSSWPSKIGPSGVHGHRLTGDAETRPENVAVNVFVRVD